MKIPKIELEFIEDDCIPTIGFVGYDRTLGHIHYNPYWVAELDPYRFKQVVRHELLHLVEKLKYQEQRMRFDFVANDWIES